MTVLPEPEWAKNKFDLEIRLVVCQIDDDDDDGGFVRSRCGCGGYIQMAGKTSLNEFALWPIDRDMMDEEPHPYS